MWLYHAAREQDSQKAEVPSYVYVWFQEKVWLESVAVALLFLPVRKKDPKKFVCKKCKKCGVGKGR